MPETGSVFQEGGEPAWSMNLFFGWKFPFRTGHRASRLSRPGINLTRIGRLLKSMGRSMQDLASWQSKLIYIASPYAGDIAGNTQFAIQCCQFAIQRGYTPVAPHLIYPQILDDTIPEQRELGLTLGYHLLAACSEMWVCGERISDGMAKEIHHAERLGINIRYIRKIEES